MINDESIEVLECNRIMKDGATIKVALLLARSVLTNEQKNKWITDDNGGRVTLAEFITAATENGERVNP